MERIALKTVAFKFDTPYCLHFRSLLYSCFLAQTLCCIMRGGPITVKRLQDGGMCAASTVFKQVCQTLNIEATSSKVLLICEYVGTTAEDAPLHSTTGAFNDHSVLLPLMPLSCHRLGKFCAPKALR